MVVIAFKKIIIKVKSVSKIKIIDQVISASNSYVLLLIPLMKRDFLLLGQISTVISLYIFWLGLIRISLVNEMLRSNYTKHKYLSNVRRGSLISIFSIPLIFLGFIFHLPFISMVLSVIFICIGVQEELLRQNCLALKKNVNAFIIDFTWILFTIFGCIWCNFKNIISLNNLLILNIFGCFFAVILGNILVLGSNREIVHETNQPRINMQSLLLPIFSTLHTIFLNIFLISANREIELGILRATLLFFLPAIFMINIQQNYFLDSIKFGIRNQLFINFRREYFRKFLFFAGISFFLSYFYVDKLTTRNDLLVIPFFAFLSVLITFYSNLEIITLVGTNFLRKLVLLRFFWLFFAAIAMWLLIDNFTLMLFNLLIVDCLFVFFSQRLSKSVKSDIHKNL